MLKRYLFFLSLLSADRRHLHSFPTRRSSDLKVARNCSTAGNSSCPKSGLICSRIGPSFGPILLQMSPDLDRKSTRLNSSHSQISYAVFCLKKKSHSAQTTSASAHYPRQQSRA